MLSSHHHKILVCAFLFYCRFIRTDWCRRRWRWWWWRVPIFLVQLSRGDPYPAWAWVGDDSDRRSSGTPSPCQANPQPVPYTCWTRRYTCDLIIDEDDSRRGTLHRRLVELGRTHDARYHSQNPWCRFICPKWSEHRNPMPPHFQLSLIRVPFASILNLSVPFSRGDHDGKYWVHKLKIILHFQWIRFLKR